MKARKGERTRRFPFWDRIQKCIPLCVAVDINGVCVCVHKTTQLSTSFFFFFFPPFTTDQKHNSMDPELRKVGEGGLSCWNACVYFGLVTMLLICFGYFFLSHA